MHHEVVKVSFRTVFQQFECGTGILVRAGCYHAGSRLLGELHQEMLNTFDCTGHVRTGYESEILILVCTLSDILSKRTSKIIMYVHREER